MKPQIIYMITEGQATDLNFHLDKACIIDRIRQACRAGITHLQIREKQLSTKNLTDLTRDVVKLISEFNIKIFVNARADLAAVCGADGVHLRSNSMPAVAVQKAFPDLEIGVSAHSLDDVEQAEKNGCNLVLLAPVFSSPGKGEPLGLSNLGRAADICKQTKLIALGGIDAHNLNKIISAGADGFAAIRSFRDEAFLTVVSKL